MEWTIIFLNDLDDSLNKFYQVAARNKESIMN